METRISVAMATYNGEKYIKEQLNSILEQLSENDEIIISDDGSNDNTLNIVESFAKKDSRIKIYKGPQNGIKQNFSNAICKTNGKYIFLADQDDVWINSKIKTILQVFESYPKVSLVVHDSIMVNKNLETLNKSFYSFRRVRNGFLNNIVKNSFIGCCMAFKKELKEKILPIPNDIPMHDQWIGLMGQLNGDVKFIDDKLLLYRRHDDNNSQFKKNSVGVMLKNRFNIIRDIIKKEKQILNNYLDKKKIAENLIYEDKENKKLITLMNTKGFEFDIYYNKDIYRVIDFSVKKSIKKRFLKYQINNDLRIKYLYFINKYYNKYQYYYYNKIIGDIGKDNIIDFDICDKFIKDNKINYKRKKNLKHKVLSIIERIKITLRFYLKTKKQFLHEIRLYCTQTNLDDYILINRKPNIISGSIDAYLIKNSKKVYFTKGYDIYNIYLNEAKILKKMNCILFPKVIFENKNFFIEEYIEGVTLENYIQKEKIDDIFIEQFKKFSIECVDILYENKIIHRDIRPSNIIVIKDKNNLISFKLIDFGCAVIENKDIFFSKHKKVWRILDTIGENYIFDKYHWDDAVSFLVLYDMLGITDIEEMKKRIGRLCEII